MTYYTTLDSPIGNLLLTSDGEHLTGLYMEDHKHNDEVGQSGWEERPDLPVFSKASVQLAEYFNGHRTTFDLPIAMDGTDFQRRVWATLQEIPCGKTISYKELAIRIGNPKASRAVGLANGRNPISIIVPCHRVIGANGDLMGYGGGIERKQQLLRLEQSVVSRQTELHVH